MRLMFERDLTPPSQYAFYQWLQHGFQADAVVHFGMHGTVEWLPGSQGTSYSWSDILQICPIYIYMRLTILQIDSQQSGGATVC